MTATGPTDNCGACVKPERSVKVRPYLTEPEGQGAVRSYYRCPECGARWTAGRLLSDEELAEYTHPAA
jgi:hypothetical protein